MLKFREHDLRRNRKKMPNSTLKKYLIKSTYCTRELTIFEEIEYLPIFAIYGGEQRKEQKELDVYLASSPCDQWELFRQKTA